MKPRVIILGLSLISGGVFSSGAAEPAREGAMGTQLRQYCDPVCQLRTQDAAFALLVETFREFHSYQIEKDYNVRLQGAAKIGEDKGITIQDNSPVMWKLRELVVGLAGKEKELREARLTVQVENLKTAYNCIRRRDEEKTGQSVPSQVNTREAAERLREYVIVQPGTMAKADLRNPRSVPAAAVLLDAPKKHLPEGQTVPPCSPGDPVTEFDPPGETAEDAKF